MFASCAGLRRSRAACSGSKPAGAGEMVVVLVRDHDLLRLLERALERGPAARVVGAAPGSVRVYLREGLGGKGAVDQQRSIRPHQLEHLVHLPVRPEGLAGEDHATRQRDFGDEGAADLARARPGQRSRERAQRAEVDAVARLGRQRLARREPAPGDGEHRRASAATDTSTILVLRPIVRLCVRAPQHTARLDSCAVKLLALIEVGLLALLEIVATLVRRACAGRAGRAGRCASSSRRP